MRRHDFSGPADLRDMQRLTSRLWTPTSRFHPGQLAWSRYYQPVDPDRTGADEAIALWRDDAGDVVGFGWAEARDWLEVQTDPEHPEVAEEVIDWFEDWSDAGSQSTILMLGDPTESAFAAAGFEPRPDEWHFEHHVLELADLPPVPVVDGYRFRHVEPHESTERAACHAAAWSDFGPSRVNGRAYAQLMQAWPYQPELDWVAVDGTGAMVASCLLWLDPDTGVGLVEPVGCDPAHRGRGLAGAVTIAALHALRQRGGATGLVSPRGDDDYPGPRRLYRSIGFRPAARTVTWTRSLS